MRIESCKQGGCIIVVNFALSKTHTRPRWISDELRFRMSIPNQPGTNMRPHSRPLIWPLGWPCTKMRLDAPSSPRKMKRTNTPSDAKAVRRAFLPQLPQYCPKALSVGTTRTMQTLLCPMICPWIPVASQRNVADEPVLNNVLDELAFVIEGLRRFQYRKIVRLGLTCKPQPSKFYNRQYLAF